MTFSVQSPGDEQCNNGETPHRGRDITNPSPLHPPFFSFPSSLQEPTEKCSLIRWDRIARLCSAFNYLKRVTRRKMRVRKFRVFFSHRATDKSPRDSWVVFENNAFPPLFLCFHPLVCRITWCCCGSESDELLTIKQCKTHQTAYLK